MRIERRRITRGMEEERGVRKKKEETGKKIKNYKKKKIKTEQRLLKMRAKSRSLFESA